MLIKCCCSILRHFLPRLWPVHTPLGGVGDPSPWVRIYIYIINSSVGTLLSGEEKIHIFLDNKPTFVCRLLYSSGGDRPTTQTTQQIIKNKQQTNCSSRGEEVCSTFLQHSDRCRYYSSSSTTWCICKYSIYCCCTSIYYLLSNRACRRGCHHLSLTTPPLLPFFANGDRQHYFTHPPTHSIQPTPSHNIYYPTANSLFFIRTHPSNHPSSQPSSQHQQSDPYNKYLLLAPSFFVVSSLARSARSANVQQYEVHTHT